MNNDTAWSRRTFLGGVCASALLPHMGLAQGASSPSFAEFAASARALSGFDVVARPLLRETESLFSDLERQALVAGSDAAAEVQKALLKALYTGKHESQGAPLRRVAYSDALMYAAIENAVNVPSYCGGVPGYWSQKPNVS